MLFITQGKTNWKFLLIIIILAIVVGAGALWNMKRLEQSYQPPEIKKPERVDTKERLPKFEDFPISEEFKNLPALPDFSSNPDALLFITKITEGAKEGPNFAGQYTIIEWGCGTECQSGVVVDAKTGTIYSTHLPLSAFGRDFRIDSNLLIIDPPETIESRYPYYPYDESGKLPAWLYSEYYKWENNQFVLVYKYKPEKIADETADWKTYSNEEYGFEMKYPEELLSTEPLQPKMKSIDCDYANFANKCPFVPIEGFTGSEEEAIRQGFAKTERLVIDGKPFCLQTMVEGAAGTIYVTYNYTSLRNKKCLVLSFAVPYPNCSNYLPISNPEMQKAYDQCKTENEITKPETINQILSTFRFIDEFCGTSSYGSCIVNSDCKAGGCSGQVCQSKYEESMITTCEYRDCYNAQSYGLDCKCVDKKCQWAK